MMPNLGQGGCQAIEDAYVLVEELSALKSRNDIASALTTYRNRRLIRSASVQGLSRFASDIIIRGFDTPAKIRFQPSFAVENFNYAGIVTKILQPILPVFFWVQFNFLYEGYQNKGKLDLTSFLGFSVIGSIILLLTAGALAEAGIGFSLGFDALLGGEAFSAGEGLDTILANLQGLFGL